MGKYPSLAAGGTNCVLERCGPSVLVAKRTQRTIWSLDLDEVEHVQTYYISALV
jgi:hypothetical protein